MKKSKKSRFILTDFPATQIILIVCLLAFTNVRATTYYLRTDGNDNNDGLSNTAGGAWITLSKAANVAAVGDTVKIAPGIYNSTATAVFSKSGDNSKHIIIKGSGSPMFRCNVRINGSYIDIDGLTISPGVYEQYFAISLDGSYNTLINCVVTNYNARASNQATAISFGTGGSYNTVQSCTIKDLDDIDVFHIWGHHQTIKNCHITNIRQLNYNLNHTDVFQSWGDSWVTAASDILIEGNLITNSSCQIGNTATDDYPVLHDWTFRNNIFANINGTFFIGIPKTFFYNNVFYKCGNSSLEYVLSFYHTNSYSSSGDQVINNAFAGDFRAIDYHNGMPPSFTLSNNYFATGNFNVKINDEIMGANFINGGDLKFIDAAGYDFHIQDGSPLINSGVELPPVFPDKDGDPRIGNWDIGIDEYNPGIGTGIGMVDSEDETLLVFPNPASDFITIKNADAKSAHVQLFNMQGIKIIDEINSGNKIDISAMKRGLYLVGLDNKVFKLIKE